MGMGADHVPLQQQSATWATLTVAARSDEAPSCCSIVTRRQKCKVPRASANCSTIRAPPRCQSSSLRSDRRLQQIVYMEKMKLGFDNRWLLPPPLQQNLSSVGCSRAGVGRSSLRVRARVYSLSLSSLSSRILTQEAAAGGFRRVFGPLRRGEQPQRPTSVRAKVAGVPGVYLNAQHV